MPLVYRIQKAQHVEMLLTGEGARLFGGRWNPVGVPLIYASSTPELALLEVLVHLDGTPVQDLPPYVQVTMEIPNGIEVIEAADLPAGWNEVVIPADLPHFLLPRMAHNYPALSFSVPSVILPASPSRNILINPSHDRIGEVVIRDVVSHLFDSRL